MKNDKTYKKLEENWKKLEEGMMPPMFAFNAGAQIAAANAGGKIANLHYPGREQIPELIQKLFQLSSHYGIKYPVRVGELKRNVDSGEIYWGKSGQEARNLVLAALKKLEGEYKITYEQLLKAVEEI
jgi:hypothetical protein